MSDKPKDIATYTKWLKEEFDKNSKEDESSDDTIEYINSYGLMEEVVDWTKRFMKEGNSFRVSLGMAYREWDL